ncbi:hypothetical protein ADK51_21625 [Streptomyces sp. WM6368]|nr:hypothetical protein B6R96_33855 [Streptomyces sp. Sge12]KOU21771.1 hypothetical protein ADK51_21625 [Streptomyces sp. WM6368]
MTREPRLQDPQDKVRSPAHRMRLPGFIEIENDIGLGEVVKHATRTVGIRPCGRCEERAQRLNQWMTFTGRRDGSTG